MAKIIESFPIAVVAAVDHRRAQRSGAGSDHWSESTEGVKTLVNPAGSRMVEAKA